MQPGLFHGILEKYVEPKASFIIQCGRRGGSDGGGDKRGKRGGGFEAGLELVYIQNYKLKYTDIRYVQ